MLGSRVRAPGGAQRQFRNELLFCFIGYLSRSYLVLNAHITIFCVRHPRHLPHFHGKTVADTHFKGGTCHGFPAISCLMFLLYYHRLPDNHSLLFWKEHRSVCDVESLVEGSDVAESCIHSVLAERVNVNLGKTCRLLIADVLAPDCRV